MDAEVTSIAPTAAHVRMMGRSVPSRRGRLLSTFLPACLPIYLSINLSIYLYLSLSISIYLHLSIYLSLSLNAWPTRAKSARVRTRLCSQTALCSVDLASRLVTFCDGPRSKAEQ
jgi:hypothetical protein